MADTDPYKELADVTRRLVSYRLYSDEAKRRKAEAIHKETENIDAETKRISEAKLRISELVAELGLDR